MGCGTTSDTAGSGSKVVSTLCAQLLVKQPQCGPCAVVKVGTGFEVMSVEVNRLRIACAVATGVVAAIGPEDLLTRQYIGYAKQLLPSRWGIPRWHNQLMYWHGTVSNYTTWRLPDRTAGVPPLPCTDDALMHLCPPPKKRA